MPHPVSVTAEPNYWPAFLRQVGSTMLRPARSLGTNVSLASFRHRVTRFYNEVEAEHSPYCWDPRSYSIDCLKSGSRSHAFTARAAAIISMVSS